MSHTPGPWEAYSFTENKIIEKDSPCWRISGKHPTKIGMRYTFAEIETFTAEECKADALLIAAAPELLAACKAMVEAFINADFPVTRIMDVSRLQASAAIAKAEGK